MKSRSLALRLAVLVALLGLLQAVGVLTFSYLTFERELSTQKRLILVDKVDQTRRLLSELADDDAIRDNAFRLVELVTGHDELHIAIAAPGATQPRVAFSPEANDSLLRLRGDTWGTDAFLNWYARSTGNPMLSMAGVGETKNGLPHEIILTIDRTDDSRVLRGLLITAVTAAPLALAIVFFSALAIVRLGLRPLRRLREAASRVSASALSERLDLAGLPTELQKLGQAFNAMLERLDDGVKRLSEFSGDFAHEMRTPLATLLGRTQVALSKERTTEELLQVLESNVDELQRLTRLVADMLFLAHADNAQSALELSEVDLVEAAHRVVDFLELLAQERGVELLIEGHASVLADRSLVQRAITNLVSNAVRHCYAQTRVTVKVCAIANGATLEVVNHGEPISSEQLPRLFDRFYRVDDARARDVGGSGLGLAIVHTIMRMHSGRVEAASSASGETRFQLFFPSRR
jgi:two-component system heavy metal sensor histidine kinase CusS